jgi:quinol-cytochrome oxidoreductase complex cytochrome b subunit
VSVFREIWRRFQQLWDDLKESIDASLLGTLRFLGLIYGPIDRRLRIDEALRKAWQYKLPAHVGWRQAFGGIAYLLLGALVVSGILLTLYYRPSVEEAYPSIQHITSEISFGWLIRDVHVWGANLLVIAVLAHMARVFFEGAYKPPRETNWLIGLGLLFVVLAFGATGYLLPWDQWSYWTVTEVMDAISRVPILGGAISEAIMGDVIVSGATLSRFFALHVIVLPWLVVALLIYHFTLVRRRGIAPPPSTPEDGPNWRLSAVWTVDETVEAEGMPFFPNHLLRSLIISAVVLALLLTLAVLFPRPVGDPANAYVLPEGLDSFWVPVDVSLAVIRYLGAWGFLLFTLFAAGMGMLPLFDRRPERHPRQRPITVTLGLVFLVAFSLAWLIGRGIKSIPPSSGLRSGDISRIGPPPGTESLSSTLGFPLEPASSSVDRDGADGRLP